MTVPTNMAVNDFCSVCKKPRRVSLFANTGVNASVAINSDGNIVPSMTSENTVLILDFFVEKCECPSLAG